MKDTPGPVCALSDAAAMVSRRWRNEEPQATPEPPPPFSPAHDSKPAPDSRKLIAAGVALFVLGVAIGFMAARYWPGPTDWESCVERAALTARSDAAMRMLASVCRLRFPD